VLFSPFLMSVRGAPQRDEALVFSSSHLYAICGLSQKMRLNWRGGWVPVLLAVLLAVFQIRYGGTYNVRLS